MGHEFVEMKNHHAAIEAYRRAVDINPRDYRAWYGLGQMYEMLHMPSYALYYYRRVVVLRPTDARMWVAMGHCFEKLEGGRHGSAEALKCFERAARTDQEGASFGPLAKLYKSQGKDDLAAAMYRRVLGILASQAPEREMSVDGAEALLFLSNYCKERNLLAEAEEHCKSLIDRGGPNMEQAKAMLRELHSTVGVQNTRTHSGAYRLQPS